MPTIELGFTQDRLRHGAILGTIAHAIWVARQPLLAAAQSWDGQVYLLNDSSGTLGTISFAESQLVGVFFDSHSERSPFSTGEPYALDDYLRQMPAPLAKLAHDETLRYMLQEHEGKDVPIITAALWSEGEQLVSHEAWASVRDNGGHIIRIQLMDTEDALGAWRDDMELSAAEVDLARALYERRMSHPWPGSRISLSPAENLLLGAGSGVAESRELLASVGIDF
jgi:hypothetical protein